MGKFSEATRAWADKAKGRRQAVKLTAAQKVIEDAQTPRQKDGLMRVVTGFLRNSGQVSFTGIPSGLARPRSQGDPGVEQDLGRALQGAPEQVPRLWFGWTAAYARKRESEDGFLITAVGRWPRYVDEAVAEAKERLP